MRLLLSLLSAYGAIAAGCVSITIAPSIDVAKVKQISVGQSKAEVERIFGQTVATFTLRAKPNVYLQTWQFAELSDIKCLMISYDAKQVVVDYEIIVKDRGRNAMPIPGGC
jgi:phage major head subunit gpT-like protein